MNCKKITSFLVDYQQDSLGPEEKKMVEEHLRTCDGCREELKEIQTLFEVLKREKTEKVEENFWTNFVPEIRKRIDRAPSPRLKWNLIPKLGPLLGFAIAILVVGIFLFSKDYSSRVSGVLTYEQMGTYSLYEFESPVDQVAGILTLAEGTEEINDLITSGNGESFMDLEKIVDDQYWEKVELQEILEDLSSEELQILENNIEKITI
ncbi:MAG: zf-HC2 domain-containing protein [Candidatus Zixiibacteriota bacterium]